MNYVKGSLSGLAAILIAEFVCFWPLVRGSKAIGLAAFVSLLAENIVSPKFWIVGVLLFSLFFAASRAGTPLRVLFFWIPTLAVSVLGCSIVALYGYLFTITRHQ